MIGLIFVLQLSNWLYNYFKIWHKYTLKQMIYENQ